MLFLSIQTKTEKGDTMNCPTITRTVDRKSYSTKTATMIASDDYWDGSNHERNGRNRFLFRTARGAYFVVTGSFWQGESNTLEPVEQSEAIDLYEGSLTEHHVSYLEAFPDVEVTEA